MNSRVRLDGLALVGLSFFALLILNVLKDQGIISLGSNRMTSADLTTVSLSTTAPSIGDEFIQLNEPSTKDPIDSNSIMPPYEHYFLTQGPHDTDYGQLAIDISAGKGAPILSPINGWVANLYIDEWGNSSLVLENYRYVVDMLHGIYSVKTGDQVKIGQPIGKESNQGNTFDPWGLPCRGRDCGFHSHINIFDKTISSNLNPLDVFPIQQ
jgi:murein DD-endopeptidase MepM/ murein hydrolase activator NlpD